MRLVGEKKHNTYPLASDQLMLFFPIIIVFSKPDVEYREKSKHHWPNWLSNWNRWTAGAYHSHTDQNWSFATCLNFISIVLCQLQHCVYLSAWCALVNKQPTNFCPNLFISHCVRLLFLIDDFLVIFAFAHRRNIYNAIVKMKVQRIHCVFLFKCVMMFTLLTINELSLSL